MFYLRSALWFAALFLISLSSPAISLLTNYFNQPESVVFDPLRNRYLVSNKGNGNIIALTPDGTQSVFFSSLGSVRGMVNVHDTLFVASDSGVVGIDMETSAILMTITLPGMQFLNDICADSSGNLYVSDSQANKIFLVDVSIQTGSSLIIAGVPGCNGLLYRQSTNSLLVCLWNYPGKIQEIDLNTLTMSTLIETGLDGCDGLAVDEAGYIYISSFNEGTIYRYDPMFVFPGELVSQGHEAPADIFYNIPFNILAVPNFNGNSVDLLMVGPVTGEEVHPFQDPDNSNSFRLFNFPNPFNGHTTISLSIPREEIITLVIIDYSGKKVASLIQQGLVAEGHYRYPVATDLNPGIYWIVLTAESGTRLLRKIMVTA